MIRRLGSHVGRRVVFGYDRYLTPELPGYLELLRDYGDVVEGVDLENLHYLSSAQLVCELVQSDPEAFGVLCCGTGMGMSIAANKFRGIYAARCITVDDAESARAINNANVVCIASRSGFGLNRQIIDAFVRTTYTGRKLEQLETIAHFELEARPAPSVPIAAALRDVRRTA
jgi:RpiB/LacA/LacB family sugar-phosphate isomerase